jgi:hypothetical protein
MSEHRATGLGYWGAPAGPQFQIVEGAEYEYHSAQPSNCTGHRYRVLRLATTAPQYQKVVVVEGLTGPDVGEWFVCTYFNFSSFEGVQEGNGAG